MRADGDPVEIRLDEGLAVAGVLRTTAGDTMRFAALRVESADPDSSVDPRLGETDVEGRFRITALTRGRWRIRLGSDTYAEQLPEVVVEAGSEALELRTVARPPAPATDEPKPQER